MQLPRDLLFGRDLLHLSFEGLALWNRIVLGTLIVGLFVAAQVDPSFLSLCLLCQGFSGRMRLWCENLRLVGKLVSLFMEGLGLNVFVKKRSRFESVSDAGCRLFGCVGWLLNHGGGVVAGTLHKDV